MTKTKSKNTDRDSSKIPAPSLTGKGAHVEPLNALDGLDWKLAGVRSEGVPHSIFELVNHVIFWQDWAIAWIDGKKPGIPEHASGSWPGGPGPANALKWKQTVLRLKHGIEGLERRSRMNNLLEKRGDKTFLQMLQTISSHNSFHIGQIVLARQIFGVWPPPSGGLTW